MAFREMTLFFAEHLGHEEQFIHEHLRQLAQIFEMPSDKKPNKVTNAKEILSQLRHKLEFGALIKKSKSPVHSEELQSNPKF
mgnify:CR=1 FL=1